MNPNQIYLLDCYQSRIRPSSIINEEAEANICKAKGFLTTENVITSKGTTVLNDFETFLVKIKKKVTSEVLGPDFNEKLKEYREIFPSKRLPSGELARQSVNELKDKFIWFFKTYPEYDWNLVLDAADYYNDVFKKKGYMFMATSSYFIKKTSQDKSISSKLADYCQEILDNPNILNGI